MVVVEGLLAEPGSFQILPGRQGGVVQQIRNGHSERVRKPFQLGERGTELAGFHTGDGGPVVVPDLFRELGLLCSSLGEAVKDMQTSREIQVTSDLNPILILEALRYAYPLSAFYLQTKQNVIMRR